jgi:hypothetical protein
LNSELGFPSCSVEGCWETQQQNIFDRHSFPSLSVMNQACATALIKSTHDLGASDGHLSFFVTSCQRLHQCTDMSDNGGKRQ